MGKLTNKQKSKTRREVDLDLGVKPPKSIIFTSKKIYNMGAWIVLILITAMLASYLLRE